MELIRIAILAAIGLVLAASVWALIDCAATAGADAGEHVQGRLGGACLVPRLPSLWPIVFPMYVARRKLWGRAAGRVPAC